HPGRPFWTEASDTEALNCGQPASCCREIGPGADPSAPSFRNRSARAGTGAGMGVAYMTGQNHGGWTMQLQESELAPDSILPAQLYERPFGGARLQPEKRLQVAVLADAVL